MNYKRFVVAADNHGGLIHQPTADKLLRFVAEWKPHYRIHLGDLWDFSPLRRGASIEEKADGISADYDAGLRFLDAFRPQFLTLGNHDDRIWQFARHCADGIMRECAEQLVAQSEAEFRKRRIKFVEYNVAKYLQLPEGGPKLIHGFRSTMYPAKAHFEHWRDCLHGHTHKPDEHIGRDVNQGKAYSVACLADLDKLTYSDRQPAKLGHRNGWLYGLINVKTGAWHAWHAQREGDVVVSPLGEL